MTRNRDFTSSDRASPGLAAAASIEGLVLFAKLYNDPGQLDSLWRSSMRLLGLDETAAVG